MAILIGIGESILVLVVCILLTMLAAWWYWRRRTDALLDAIEKEHRAKLAALRETQDRQQQAEIRNMISVFKHQALGCLRPIKDNLFLLKKEMQTRAVTESLADSVAGINYYEWRLTRLVENMAFVSRLEGPDFSLPFPEVKLDVIVSDLIDDFQRAAKKKGIRLAWWAAPEKFPRMTANEESLRQVLINLIDNAIGYCGENDEIDVALEANEANKVIHIRASDTGPGIPKEDWDRIFQKGYTVEGARGRKPKAGSQGLGLYIVKLVVEKHGGTIDVTSRLSKGTTFTITLPIQRG